MGRILFRDCWRQSIFRYCSIRRIFSAKNQMLFACASWWVYSNKRFLYLSTHATLFANRIRRVVPISRLGNCATMLSTNRMRCICLVLIVMSGSGNWNTRANAKLSNKLIQVIFVRSSFDGRWPVQKFECTDVNTISWLQIVNDVLVLIWNQIPANRRRRHILVCAAVCIALLSSLFSCVTLSNWLDFILFLAEEEKHWCKPTWTIRTFIQNSIWVLRLNSLCMVGWADCTIWIDICHLSKWKIQTVTHWWT